MSFDRRRTPTQCTFAVNYYFVAAIPQQKYSYAQHRFSEALSVQL